MKEETPMTLPETDDDTIPQRDSAGVSVTTDVVTATLKATFMGPLPIGKAINLQTTQPLSFTIVDVKSVKIIIGDGKDPPDPSLKLISLAGELAITPVLTDTR